MKKTEIYRAHLAKAAGFGRKVLESKPGKLWKSAMVLSAAAAMIGVFCIYRILTTGLSVLGINNYINWCILITSFVFWIGIGHAGTFISAILLLLNQDWRKSISRAAEAMTIISLLIAAFMPILHLGKPELFYQLLPFPNRTTYPLVNFNSPLSWDFMAIGTYFMVSMMFFLLGTMPDMGLLRDSSPKGLKKYIYNFFSFGWNGSASAWSSLKKTTFIMAGLITPLVISVHSIVSFDFAVTLKPGWHSGIFPIYFVTGAVFSGFAMISLIVSLAGKVLNIREQISIDHLEKMNKIILLTGSLLLYIFLAEIFSSFLSGNHHELYNLMHKISGHYGWLYVLMLLSTLVLPQFFWKKSIRRSVIRVFIINFFIVAGMFLERFFIVIGSSERGFLASGFTDYKPGFYVYGMVIGNAGIFALLFLMMFRFLPFIPKSERKEL